MGQNESGKSSVLKALEWLTEEDETSLSEFDKTRGAQKNSGWVVGAYFDLEVDDLALLEPLGFEKVPRTLCLWKQVDGSVVYSMRDPARPKRSPIAFEVAQAALERAKGRLKPQIDAATETDADGPQEWIEEVESALEDPEVSWDESAAIAARVLAAWLDEVPLGRKRSRDATAALRIREACELGCQEHPKDQAIDILSSRVPKFLLFSENDRELPTITNAELARRGAVSPALGNILKIAGISPAKLWDYHSAGLTGDVLSHLGDGNRRLYDFFTQAWNQSNVTVEIGFDGNGLHAHILEVDTHRYTRIEERSDGLRTFVALAAFLEAQDLAVPPILLIDEAETHLHFDAQADLVGALLTQVKATQIYYSTHSPGCLPSDLGTGIRLLRRERETSTILSHFWANEEPGFGSLLFAMGAGAAAFSVCRWAVLAEGASDMVMLPTLIRLATNVTDLPYQVAPGLSNARKYGMDVEEMAAKVVYLTDGDAQGASYRRDLVTVGVPVSRIFQLPEGMATEDLLAVGFLLDLISEMLPNGSPIPNPSLASDAEPIMLTLKRWASAQSPEVKLPGKVALAYKIIEHHKPRLKPQAKRALATLHTQFVRSLSENHTH